MFVDSSDTIINKKKTSWLLSSVIPISNKKHDFINFYSTFTIKYKVTIIHRCNKNE